MSDSDQNLIFLDKVEVKMFTDEWTKLGAQKIFLATEVDQRIRSDILRFAFFEILSNVIILFDIRIRFDSD